MSHSLDIDGVLEKLILLQHFSFGSKKYCSDRSIGSSKDTGDGEFDIYWSWTKAIVSNYIIDCSIKIRILLDIIENKEDLINLSEIDSNAIKGLEIGKVIDGKFDLNLRESCNKIIHAKKAIPIWSKGRIDGISFKYWQGLYELSGTHNNQKWRIILNIHYWAKAMENFIKLFETSDAYVYIGQDWY